MVTCTGHIGIHEGADGRTYVRCTDVHDVMAIKPNFLTSMGYHIFLSMVLRARGAPLLTVLRTLTAMSHAIIHVFRFPPLDCYNFGRKMQKKKLDQITIPVSYL